MVSMVQYIASSLDCRFSFIFGFPKPAFHTIEACALGNSMLAVNAKIHFKETENSDRVSSFHLDTPMPYFDRLVAHFPTGPRSQTPSDPERIPTTKI